jgi:hypothetical protein
MRPSKPDSACDKDLSLLEMRVGATPGSKWREADRTEGAGSPIGEQGRSRLRRTENLPGGRPGIPRHNATVFVGGRMSKNNLEQRRNCQTPRKSYKTLDLWVEKAESKPSALPF